MVTIRVAVLEPHPLWLESLRAVLARESHIELAGAASDLSSAFELVASSNAGILLASYSPECGAMDLPEFLRGLLSLPCKVLLMTDVAADPGRVGLIGAGRLAVLPRSAAPDALVAGIAALHGERQLHGELPNADRMPSDAISAGDASGALVRPLSDVLGRRERQVFKLVVGGKSSVDIARTMNISPSTVNVHRRNIRKKLGLHSTAALVRLAADQGLLARSGDTFN